MTRGRLRRSQRRKAASAQYTDFFEENENSGNEDSQEPPSKRARHKGKSLPAQKKKTVTYLPSPQLSSFPPAIYANTTYSAGICLNVEKKKNDLVVATIPTKYNNCDLQPVLSPEDASMWFHKYAATSAAQSHYPSEVFRFLGTITRTYKSSKPILASSQYDRGLKCGLPHPRLEHRTILSRPSKGQFMKEARKELLAGNADAIAERTAEIHAAWSERYRRGPTLIHTWHFWSGHLTSVNHKSYIPVHFLLRHIEGTTNEVCSLYGGLREIATDTKTVLEALSRLSHPEDGLYKTPLITAYPLVSRNSEGYNLCIGVYAHRLLSEVMTQDLLVVMSALDEGSYRCTQPLIIPPSPTHPAFQASRLPKVVFRSREDEGNDETNQDEPDMTIASGTRSEATISAFSTGGLLKLLENEGNEISNWPAIQPLLTEKLAMSLMLHQQHAVCWMLQMEQLGGFGINSILWEEREFNDGGKYYYSPALGQLRLEKPPIVTGGILADEMGLGKTLSLVALVVATLEDIKKEVQKRDQDNTEAYTSVHSTLIIVPPALQSQWLVEISKATGDTLVVDCYDHRTCTFKRGSSGGSTSSIADVVVACYPALEKPSTARPLKKMMWGRIVLDEMQEIRSSTSEIAKSCESLLASRRWMLSGTPLFEGISDLRGELNFLGLPPFCANLEDGYFNYAVLNPWIAEDESAIAILKILGLVMLRRSKSMTIRETGEPLLGLPPLTVEYVPISQRPSERALYCFLECVVAKELRAEEEGKSSCLRLLREICFSPVLINGGMGVSSQLHVLNELLVKEYRRQEKDQTPCIKKRSDWVISCTQAMQHLAQLQGMAQTSDDFVSDMWMGVGAGAVQRARATESAEVQIQRCRETLNSATEQVKKSKVKRARARWHWAMECVTTGDMHHASPTRRSRHSALWRWRWVIKRLLAEAGSTSLRLLPAFLVRGWRPSESLVKGHLYRTHPEFAWAHPRSLEICRIPPMVTKEEIGHSMNIELPEIARSFRVVGDPSAKGDKEWRAVLQFERKDDAKLFLQKVQSRKGLSVKTDHSIPFIQEAIESAKEDLAVAEAAHKVYPTNATRRKVVDARKIYRLRLLGLRITMPSKTKDEHDMKHIHLMQFGQRSIQPATSFALFKKFDEIVGEAASDVAHFEHIVHTESRNLERLQRTSDVSEEVKSMSAFEALQALKSKRGHSTWCPICLGPLGHNDLAGHGGLVTLTNCGHLFCKSCLSSYMKSRQTSIQCPNCRKPLASMGDLIQVNPALSHADEELTEKRRKEAKAWIKTASAMLESSNGQLSPKMWDKLFLSIDLPVDVSNEGELRYTAIPSEVVQHFRECTGMSGLGCRSAQTPAQRSRESFRTGYSSKVAAVVNDIPRHERSVVVCRSRNGVAHLSACFTESSIGHRALFTGQTPAKSHEAIVTWQKGELSDDGSMLFPVLLIQAGAAASGLTLTAACKIFLMEPLLRLEEERQVYARCHRYGQTKPVEVKCYYTPVSVESRLLEWRRRSTANRKHSDEKVVFSGTNIVNDPCDDEEDSDMESRDSDADEDEDPDRTSFLLGI